MSPEKTRGPALCISWLATAVSSLHFNKAFFPVGVFLRSIRQALRACSKAKSIFPYLSGFRALLAVT